MHPRTIIFIGPQGSGKGTQIEKLHTLISKRDPVRRLVDIQTGRRFRALAAKHETFGERKIAQTLKTGELQPDFLVHFLWAEAMFAQLDPKSHVLIDGVPRTLEQAKMLDDGLRFFERGTLDVVNLAVPEEIVRERMQARARSDDTDESIETRLRWYREDTVPVLDYYRGRPDTVVHDIDGTQDIDAVHTAIADALDISHHDH